MQRISCISIGTYSKKCSVDLKSESSMHIFFPDQNFITTLRLYSYGGNSPQSFFKLNAFSFQYWYLYWFSWLKKAYTLHFKHTTKNRKRIGGVSLSTGLHWCTILPWAGPLPRCCTCVGSLFFISLFLECIGLWVTAEPIRQSNCKEYRLSRTGSKACQQRLASQSLTTTPKLLTLALVWAVFCIISALFYIKKILNNSLTNSEKLK